MLFIFIVYRFMNNKNTEVYQHELYNSKLCLEDLMVVLGHFIQFNKKKAKYIRFTQSSKNVECKTYHIDTFIVLHYYVHTHLNMYNTT